MGDTTLVLQRHHIHLNSGFYIQMGLFVDICQVWIQNGGDVMNVKCVPVSQFERVRIFKIQFSSVTFYYSKSACIKVTWILKGGEVFLHHQCVFIIAHVYV